MSIISILDFLYFYGVEYWDEKLGIEVSVIGYFITILVFIASILLLSLTIFQLKNPEKINKLILFTIILFVFVGMFSIIMFIDRLDQFLSHLEENGVISWKYYSKYYDLNYKISSDSFYELLLMIFSGTILSFFSYIAYEHLTKDTLDGIVKKRYFTLKFLPIIGAFEIILAIFAYYSMHDAVNKIQLDYSLFFLIISPMLMGTGIILLSLFIQYLKHPFKILDRAKMVIAIIIICLFLLTGIGTALLKDDLEFTKDRELPLEIWNEHLVIDSKGNLFGISSENNYIIIHKYNKDIEIISEKEIKIADEENLTWGWILNLKIDKNDNFQILLNIVIKKTSKETSEISNEIGHLFIIMDSEGILTEKIEILNSQNSRIIDFKVNSNETTILMEGNKWIEDQNDLEIIDYIQKMVFKDGKLIENITIWYESTDFKTYSILSKDTIYVIYLSENQETIKYNKYLNNGTIIIQNQTIQQGITNRIFSLLTDNDDQPIIIYSSQKLGEPSAIYMAKIMNNTIIQNKLIEEKDYTWYIDTFTDDENNLYLINYNYGFDENEDYFTYFIVNYYKFNNDGNLLKDVNLKITDMECFKRYREYIYFLDSSYSYSLIDINNEINIFYTVLWQDNDEPEITRISNRFYIKVNEEGKIVTKKSLTPMVDKTSVVPYVISLGAGIIIAVLTIIILFRKDFEKNKFHKIEQKEEAINNSPLLRN